MKEKYIEDLKEIKDIMNRSSRFVALSGWSGICAGLIAIVGSYFAITRIFTNQDYLSYQVIQLPNELILNLVFIAASTFLLALICGLYFTHREAKKHDQAIWDSHAKRLLMNLAIPLLTGGLVCSILLLKGLIGLVAPLSLIFYGLSLINASKYTLNEIRSLGLMEIILGILALSFIDAAMLFWVLGFGILHIVYGIYMQWTTKE